MTPIFPTIAVSDAAIRFVADAIMYAAEQAQDVMTDAV